MWIKDILNWDTQLTLLLNGSESVFIDGIAWYSTRTITWLLMAIVLLYIIIRHNKLSTSIAIIACLFLSILLADQVASGIFKPLIQRFRPTHDPALAHLIDTVNGYRGGKYGFFSSHASNTFAVATFITLLMRNKWVAATGYSFALLNCWTRIYLGVHFVGDILTGIAFGLFSGWLCYRLFILIDSRIIVNNPSQSISRKPYSRQEVFLFVGAFLLTLFYIIVRAWVE